MKTLEYPDRHRVNAAIGWIELGNVAEAKLEADAISLPGRAHPEAFLVRWKVAARLENWSEAHRIATVFTKVVPSQVIGWICLSYSLYRLKRPLEAWMQLLPRTADFPRVSAIPYMLACYAHELGNHKLASQFLVRSADLGGPREIKGCLTAAGDLPPLAVAPPATSPGPDPTVRPPIATSLQSEGRH